MEFTNTTEKKHAHSLFQNQNFGKAGACFEKICHENPQDDEAWLMQGLCLQRLGRIEQAIACLERAVSINPMSEKAKNLLGQAWLAKGWVDHAIMYLRDALRLRDDYIDAHKNLIIALLASNRYHEAVEASREALKHEPSSADLQCQLAVALEQTHQMEYARSAAETALKLNPEHVRASLIIAKLDKRSGRLENARDRLLGELRKSLPPIQAATLAAELGDVLDRMGKYITAYHYFNAGNQILAQTVTPAQAEQGNIINQLGRYQRYFTSSSTKDWADAVLPDDKPSPIFLIGFPRSGTTLTEQTLASLEQIVPSDEQPFLSRLISELPMMLERPFRYPEDLGTLNAEELEKLRAHYWTLVHSTIGMLEDGKRLLDKLPLNILDLGMVYRLFPDARVIVVIRDPRDCCLSCFMQPFKLNQSMINFLSLEQSAKFYAVVLDLLEHYREVLGLQFLEIRYEDLVSDFETEAHKLVNFSGEKWDDTVLRFFEHARKRNVSTPSYSGVASPIYSRSIGRWQNYTKQLQPILQTLDPYIKKFGYQ